MFRMYAAGMLGAACLLPLVTQSAQAQDAAKPAPIQSVKVTSQRNPSKWFKAESQHVILYSDTNNAEAYRVLNNLERLDYLLRVYLRGYDKTRAGAADAANAGTATNAEPKLTLYYAARIEDLRGLGLSQPANAVGLYNSCASGVEGFAVQQQPVEDVNNAELAKHPLNDTLSHVFEAYARHFVYRHTDVRAPTWFIDGLAQYFSTVRFTDNQMLVGRTPPALGGYLDFLEGHRRSLDYDDILNQNDSEGINYAKKAGIRLEFEAKSWILVHYILSTEDNRRRLGAYLKAYYDGTPSVQAFETAFGMKLSDLSTTLWRYRLQKAEVKQIDQPALPRASADFTGLPQVASDFVLTNAALKACPGREQDAKLLAGLRSDAAGAPGDATAQLTLSRALVAAGQAGEALPHLDKLLAKDEANAELHLLAGLANLRAAEQDAAAKPARLAAAQRHLTRARELDPHAPAVALAILRADLIANGEPGQPALEGVIAAWRRTRDVGVLGKTAALSYAWLGDGISSENLLKAMASNRRDPAAAAWAADWKKRLDAGLTRADLRAGLAADPWADTPFREWTVAQDDVLQTVIANASFQDARHALDQSPDVKTGEMQNPVPELK